MGRVDVVLEALHDASTIAAWMVKHSFRLEEEASDGGLFVQARGMSEW